MESLVHLVINSETFSESSVTIRKETLSLFELEDYLRLFEIEWSPTPFDVVAFKKELNEKMKLLWDENRFLPAPPPLFTLCKQVLKRSKEKTLEQILEKMKKKDNFLREFQQYSQRVFGKADDPLRRGRLAHLVLAQKELYTDDPTKESSVDLSYTYNNLNINWVNVVHKILREMSPEFLENIGGLRIVLEPSVTLGRSINVQLVKYLKKLEKFEVINRNTKDELLLSFFDDDNIKVLEDPDDKTKKGFMPTAFFSSTLKEFRLHHCQLKNPNFQFFSFLFDKTSRLKRLGLTFCELTTDQMLMIFTSENVVNTNKLVGTSSRKRSSKKNLPPAQLASIKASTPDPIKVVSARETFFQARIRDIKNVWNLAGRQIDKIGVSPGVRVGLGVGVVGAGVGAVRTGVATAGLAGVAAAGVAGAVAASVTVTGVLAVGVGALTIFGTAQVVGYLIHQIYPGQKGIPVWSTDLQHLDLSHNQIDYVPACINNLEFLESLDLSNNILKTKKVNFTNIHPFQVLPCLVNLTKFHVHNNPELDTINTEFLDFLVHRKRLFDFRFEGTAMYDAITSRVENICASFQDIPLVNKAERNDAYVKCLPQYLRLWQTPQGPGGGRKRRSQRKKITRKKQ